jgi:hypothetical protein
MDLKHPSYLSWIPYRVWTHAEKNTSEGGDHEREKKGGG